MKRPILWAVVAALLLAACGAQEDPTPTPNTQPQQRDFVSATGQVVPATFTQVAFSTGGEVIELNVDVGDMVEEGDVIAQLDAEQFEFGIRSAEAALASAEADLAAAENALDDAIEDAEEDDEDTTNEDESEITDDEQDGIDAAEDFVTVAEAQVEKAEADLAAAELQVEQATLTAPYSGVVVERLVDLNEFVGPGQPIVVMGDLSTLEIRTTDLNELDVVLIEPGSEVIITFDALPDVEVSGTVESIAPKSSFGTGVNYTAVITMQDVPDTVRWGMTAFVDIRITEE